MGKINVSEATYKKLAKLARSYINEKGEEVNNPVPLNIRVDVERPPHIKEQMQRLLRGELNRQAMEQGIETWEEALDFDIEDPFEMEPPETHYTLAEDIMYNQTQDPTTIVEEPIKNEETPAKETTPQQGNETT